MSRPADQPFARLMRALLTERGVSYRALAAQTFHGKTHLHDLANGRKTPTPEIARRIDDALSAGGRLASLAAPTPIDTTAGLGDTDDVLRRTLLAALAGLTAGSATVADLVTAIADGGRQSSTAADWQDTAWGYGYAYLALPRAELLRDVTADLTVLQRLLPAASGTRRAGLHDAAARLAALVAMACTDLGHQREARATWQLARRFAADSASVDSQMWVRGQEATLGCYSGRPLPVVLDLAERGLAIHDTAAVAGRVELLAARAQALAQIGRPSDAVAALDPLRRAFDALTDTVSSPTGTIYAWPHRRLLHTESFVYSLAGAPVHAARAHDAAIAGYPATRVVSRCQIELHRATRLVRDGNVDEGMTHAGRALAGLAGHQRGRFVLTLADTVLASVPTADSARVDVADFRDYLSAARSATAHG